MLLTPSVPTSSVPTPIPASSIQIATASDTESLSRLKDCIPTDNHSGAKEDRGASGSIGSVEQWGGATSRGASSRKSVTASSADDPGQLTLMNDYLSDSLEKVSNVAFEKTRSNSSFGSTSEKRSDMEPLRVGSGRMSGLRRELMSGGELTDHVGNTTRGSDQAEGLGLRSRAGSHPVSRRSTGLRGELTSRKGSAIVTGSRAVSRLGSGRTTGLRGELAQDQDDDDDVQLRTFSTPSLSTETLSDHYIPRLGTAVLAKGNRPIFLGNSGSDTCLPPEIISCRDEDTFLEDQDNTMVFKLLLRAPHKNRPVSL